MHCDEYKYINNKTNSQHQKYKIRIIHCNEQKQTSVFFIRKMEDEEYSFRFSRVEEGNSNWVAK